MDQIFERLTLDDLAIARERLAKIRRIAERLVAAIDAEYKCVCCTKCEKHVHSGDADFCGGCGTKLPTAVGGR